MNQKTKPDIWPTDKPFIVFMVPTWRADEYQELMTKLTVSVLQDLGWESDDIEMLGLLSHSIKSGTEGLYFLDENGVNTRSITVLMLWGDTANSVNFDGYVSEECGIGKVIFPNTGAVIPTVRMPSLESNWWSDALHMEYAVTVFAEMIRDGRMELDGTEPFVFVTEKWHWN